MLNLSECLRGRSDSLNSRAAPKLRGYTKEWENNSLLNTSLQIESKAHT